MNYRVYRKDYREGDSRIIILRDDDNTVVYDYCPTRANDLTGTVIDGIKKNGFKSVRGSVAENTIDMYLEELEHYS